MFNILKFQLYYVHFLLTNVACNTFLQTQASTRKWLVEQSLKVPEMQLLEPQVCLISV